MQRYTKSFNLNAKKVSQYFMKTVDKGKCDEMKFSSKICYPYISFFNKSYPGRDYFWPIVNEFKYVKATLQRFKLSTFAAYRYFSLNLCAKKYIYEQVYVQTKGLGKRGL